MVFKTRYLLMMAVMLMLLNWVNTTGGYILDSIVLENAIAQVGSTDQNAIKSAIGQIDSTYFTYVNVLGLLLQMFVVSRVVKHLGVGFGIMILPVIPTAHPIIVFFPLLRAARTAKVAENATDYSLNNTIKNMLFLPVRRNRNTVPSRRSIRSSSAWAMCSRRCSCSWARLCSHWTHEGSRR